MRIKRIGVLWRPFGVCRSGSRRGFACGLVGDLARAARAGDEAGFLAELSSGTHRAMADAEAARSKLAAAQAQYSAALSERFGSGRIGGGTRFPGSDHGTALSRFVDITLTSVDQKTPREAVLHLSTVTKVPGGRPRSRRTCFQPSRKGRYGSWT